jgi:DNA-binding NtrC family response regulator
LRERREDIPLLVEHFIRYYAQQYGKKVEGVSPEAMNFLTTHPWEGNVRELKNSIARAVILCRGNSLELKDVSDEPLKSLRGAADPRANTLLGELPPEGVTLRDMEAELIKRTLESCDWNKSLTARRLGISRKSLYEKLGRYSIPVD